MTSPMQYWQVINPKTMIDVFQSPQIGIVIIKNEKGEQFLQAVMSKMMNSFLSFYSVNGQMDAFQVADTINLIIETYPHYCLEDFKLFFKMAKKGLFGDVFGRMDGSVIMNWLAKYDIQRDTVAQEQSIREQDKFKELSQMKGEGVSYKEYLKIKKRAENGDEEAIQMLTAPFTR